MTKSATLTHLGSVLCWEMWTPSSLSLALPKYTPPQRLVWEGFNSPFWWDTVGNLSWYRQQKDDLGNTWEIDFHTNQVTLNK